MVNRFICPNSPFYLLVVACMGICSTHLRAADPDDLLSFVRTSHRVARESIHTLSATITIELAFPKKQTVAAGKYWRSLNVVRVQEGNPDIAVDDYLSKDSEIRQVGRSRRSKNEKYQYAATRKSPSDFFCMCDAWVEMLIDFPGPGGGQYDFDRFLEFAKQIPRAKREKLDGRECVRLTMSFDTPAGYETDITLWHDVGYNYLIRKMAMTSKSPDHAEAQAEVVDFLESPPGVFLPVKCQRRYMRRGELTQVKLATLSKVRVNEPLDKTVLKLPAIPAGTVLRDWVRGTSYPVDEEWRPIGTASPLSKMTVVGSSAGQAEEYRAQSTEEPKSYTRWLIPASLAVLAMAGAGWLYRRSRSARAGVTP